MTIAGGQSDAGSAEGQAKNDAAAAAAAAGASASNGSGKPDAEHVTYSKEEMVNIVEERLKKVESIEGLCAHIDKYLEEKKEEIKK